MKLIVCILSSFTIRNNNTFIKYTIYHLLTFDIFDIGEFGVVRRAFLCGWKGKTDEELVAVKTMKGKIQCTA